MDVKARWTLGNDLGGREVQRRNAEPVASDHLESAELDGTGDGQLKKVDRNITVYTSLRFRRL